jgi:diguanylate cyclase (GGDEF)-like protein
MHGITNRIINEIPSNEVLQIKHIELQQVLCELAEAKQKLIAQQEQSKAMRAEIENLSTANTRLRHKLVRLAQKTIQARHCAYHDNLTGLPNRSLLMDRLNQAIVRATRQHKILALLFIDLDGFKSVNDNLGHMAGDNLLQQVALRLTNCVRGDDTVCRYGGDEFVVMLPEVDDEESVVAVVEKIHTYLDAPYIIDSEIVQVTASIGAASHPFDGKNVNDLIKKADDSMYSTKRKKQSRTPVLSQNYPAPLLSACHNL